ncbi:hypothetical protein A6R68_24091, partial [Neotoma lepida]
YHDSPSDQLCTCTLFLRPQVSSVSKESLTYASMTFKPSEENSNDLTGNHSTSLDPTVYSQIKVESSYLPLQLPDCQLDPQVSVYGNGQQGHDGGVGEDQNHTGHEKAGIEVHLDFQADSNSQRHDQRPNSDKSLENLSCQPSTAKYISRSPEPRTGPSCSQDRMSGCREVETAAQSSH